MRFVRASVIVIAALMMLGSLPIVMTSDAGEPDDITDGLQNITGDWIINAATMELDYTWDDEEINMAGGIVEVTSGYSLTLNNCTLRFNVAFGNQFGLYVDEDAALVLTNTTVECGSVLPYRFLVNGTITMTDSEVYNASVVHLQHANGTMTRSLVKSWDGNHGADGTDGVSGPVPTAPTGGGVGDVGADGVALTNSTLIMVDSTVIGGNGGNGGDCGDAGSDTDGGDGESPLTTGQLGQQGANAGEGMVMDNSTLLMSNSVIMGGRGGEGGDGGDGGDGLATAGNTQHGGHGGQGNAGGDGGSAIKSGGSCLINLTAGSRLIAGNCGESGKGGKGGDATATGPGAKGVGGNGGDIQRLSVPQAGYALVMDSGSTLNLIDSEIRGGNGTTGFTPGDAGNSESTDTNAFTGATLPTVQGGKLAGRSQTAIYAVDSSLHFLNSAVYGGSGADGGDGGNGGLFHMDASPTTYAVATSGGAGGNPSDGGTGVYVTNCNLTINNSVVYGGHGGNGGSGGNGSTCTAGSSGGWLMAGEGGDAQMGSSGYGGTAVIADGACNVFLQAGSMLLGGDGGVGGFGGHAGDSVGSGGVLSASGGDPDGGDGAEGAGGGIGLYADSSSENQLTLVLEDSAIMGGDGGDGGLSGNGSDSQDGSRPGGTAGNSGDGGAGGMGVRITKSNPGSPYVDVTASNITVTGGDGGNGGPSGDSGLGGWSLGTPEYMTSGTGGAGADALNMVEIDLMMVSSTGIGGNGGLGSEGGGASNSTYTSSAFDAGPGGYAGSGGAGGDGGEFRLSPSLEIMTSWFWGGDGGTGGNGSEGGDTTLSGANGGNGGTAGIGGNGGHGLRLAQSTMELSTTNSNGGAGGDGGTGGEGGDAVGGGGFGGLGGIARQAGSAGYGIDADRVELNASYLTVMGGAGGKGGGGAHSGTPPNTVGAESPNSMPASGSDGGTGFKRYGGIIVNTYLRNSWIKGGPGADFNGIGANATDGGVAVDYSATITQNVTTAKCNFTGGTGGDVTKNGDGVNGTATPGAGDGGVYALKTEGLGWLKSKFNRVEINSGKAGTNNVVGGIAGVDGSTVFSSTTVTIFNNCTIKNTGPECFNISMESKIDLLNTTYDNSTLMVYDFSLINVTWFLEVYVYAKTGPLSPVVVYINNSQGAPVYQKITPANGTFEWLHIMELVKTGSAGLSNFNAYNIDCGLFDYIPKTVKPVVDHSFNQSIKMMPVNHKPEAPTNIQPATTHDDTPLITWTASVDQDLDDVTYNVSLYQKLPFQVIFEDQPTGTSTQKQVSSQLVYGQTYTVKIQATDVRGMDAALEAETDFDVTNEAPSQPGISLAPVNPRTADDLTVSIDIPSIDNDTNPPDEISYGYMWFKDNVHQSAHDDLITLSNTYTSKGEVWKVRVTPTDNIAEGIPHRVEVTILNTPPNVAATNPYPATLEFDEDTSNLDTIDLDSVFEDADMDTLLFTYSGNSQITLDISEDNTVDFIPAEDWNGQEVITFNASDQDATHEGFVEWVLTVTINPVNDKPEVLTPTADLVATEDVLFQTTLTGQDLRDGDTVVMDLTPQPGQTAPPAWIMEAYDAGTATLSFTPGDAEVGVYKLRVQAHDQNGTAEDNYAYLDINLTVKNVNDEPWATIDEPADGSSFTTGTVLDLSGSSGDDDLNITDGPEELSYKWTSSLAGDIGVQEDLTGILLDEGFHRITFTVTDVADVVAQDSIQITIEDREVPVVGLTAPGDGATVDELEVELTWSLEYNGTDEVKYIVYMGPTADLGVDNIKEPSYEDTSYKTAVEDGKTYYWTVVPKVGSLTGNCRSGTFSFSVDTGHVSEYGVAIALDPEELTMKPGDTKTAEATITNEGTVADLIIPSLSSPELAGVTMDQKDQEVSFGIGESLTFVISVTAPSDAEDDAEYEIVVKATSKGSNSAETDDATLKVKIDFEAPDEPDIDPSKDKDGDGMLDAWEILHDLDPEVNDAGEDPDDDGLSNIDEFKGADGVADSGDETDPQDPDSDDDTYSDKAEVDAGTDPNNADDHPEGDPDVPPDTDGTGGGGTDKEGKSNTTMMILVAAIVAVVIVVVVVMLLMVSKKKAAEAAAKAAEEEKKEDAKPGPAPAPGAPTPGAPTPGAPSPAPGAPAPSPGAPAPAPGAPAPAPQQQVGAAYGGQQAAGSQPQWGAQQATGQEYYGQTGGQQVAGQAYGAGLQGGTGQQLPPYQ